MPYHETASFFGFCSTFQRFGQLEPVFLFVFRVVQQMIRFVWGGEDPSAVQQTAGLGDRIHAYRPTHPP
jgi:hypothetical protein